MRKLAGIAAAAAVATVIAGSNVSFAAEPKKDAQNPPFGTWEYQWALETGNLRSDLGKSEAKPDFDPSVSLVEIGGQVYRLGIDTP